MRKVEPTENPMIIHTFTQQMPCTFSYKDVAATMSGIIMIRSGSETDLQAAVAFAGPIAVAVDASSTAFRVNKCK